jgi:hypothetical protein
VPGWPGAGAAHTHVAASVNRIPAVRTPRRCSAKVSPRRSSGAQIVVEGEDPPVSAQSMGPGDMQRKPAVLLIFSRATWAG